MKNRPETIIEARDLAYHYPGEENISSPALCGINLSVQRGEYVSLIGPNGSGKTTLLKLFNALLAPTEGEVRVEGISTLDEDKHPDIRRSCGMIFQNPDNQLVATTVEEDIAFGLENLALPAAEMRRRVDAVASELGLSHLLKQPPHLLSGGEKGRVAIAGVLAMQPSCILMDEPTAMLDSKNRQDVLGAVRELNSKHGIAVLHVTHFPEEAARADRVVVLNQGKIVGQGAPKKLMNDLDFLHNLSLQGTAASELAFLLREDGFSLPHDLLDCRELVQSICLLEQKN